MRKPKALLPLSRELGKRGRRSSEDRREEGSCTRGSTTIGRCISTLLCSVDLDELLLGQEA